MRHSGKPTASTPAAEWELCRSAPSVCFLSASSSASARSCPFGQSPADWSVFGLRSCSRVENGAVLLLGLVKHQSHVGPSMAIVLGHNGSFVSGRSIETSHWQRWKMDPFSPSLLWEDTGQRREWTAVQSDQCAPTGAPQGPPHHPLAAVQERIQRRTRDASHPSSHSD
ncbi:hypothetical protein AAFF_G00019580 [Aldrovandia affinis]|uniref:Uncharacterized protein n=1 Tax=Aldrovandia affinis TaxID=143900 RepID=A0AAD7S7S0_9TELE|nr:hypothetical protein AAFF_G00019580 [Aldrovandia affinis]